MEPELKEMEGESPINYTPSQGEALIKQ